MVNEISMTVQIEYKQPQQRKQQGCVSEVVDGPDKSYKTNLSHNPLAHPPLPQSILSAS